MEQNEKDMYYLKIALQVSKRSTCLRRKYGAVIVKDDRILSTGFNGAPRGHINCTKIGTCKRTELNIPHGKQYELCRAVHAEQNAVIFADYSDMQNATLYLAGMSADGEVLAYPECCDMCKRVILNARISRVVYLQPQVYDYDKALVIHPFMDWIEGQVSGGVINGVAADQLGKQSSC